MKTNFTLPTSSHHTIGALKIAGTYLLIGVLWILFSDRVAAWLVQDVAMLTRISIYKGWGYVLITAILLYSMIRQQHDRSNRADERYQFLIEQASDGIFIVGQDEKYTYVNAEACKIVGYTREELLSMTVRDLIPPDEIKRNPLRFDELRAGEAVRFERVFARKDKSRIVCEVSARMLPDGQFHTIVRDVTARKVSEEALARSEQRFRSLFENMTNGFARCQILYDQNGAPNDFVFLDVNDTFRGLPGMHDVLGRRVTDLIPGIRKSNPEIFEIFDRVAKTGKPERFETFIPEMDSGMWFSVSAYSTEKGFLGIIFNVITKRKKAEEALKRHYQQLVSFIEQAPLSIAMFDRDMNYLAVSRRWGVEYGGEEPSGLIGRNHYEVHPDIPDEWREVHQRGLNGEYLQNDDDVWERADGSKKWLSWSVSPWKNEEGVVGGIIVSTEDVTKRKQAEVSAYQNEVRYHRVLDAMMEGCQIIDFDWRYVYVNDVVAHQGKQRPDELVGRTMMEMYPGIDQTEMFKILEYCMENRESERMENEFVFPDGSIGWFELSIQPAHEGIFILSTDITKRKRAEIELQRMNDELEHRVTERTSQLAAANKELEAFTYSVSHDLRAPLRAVSGFTRILMEDYEPLLDTEGKRVCTIIDKEAARMGTLVDDLLAFSKLNRVDMQTTKIDMNTQVESVFSELASSSTRERIDLKVDVLPPLTGDASLMRQVWTNLLANAIKFSSRKERAVIEVGCRQMEDELDYFVHDNGAGFDMEYADKLFNVFQRLHRDNEYEGTGVGLAIVQRVVHRHGGRVWAEGHVDEGATFHVVFPKERGS